MIDAIRVDCPPGCLRQDIFCRKRRRRVRVADRFEQEDRHVFCEILKNAIGRLVRVDAESRPHNHLV